MANKPLCPYCGKHVEKIDAQKRYQNRTYHSYCYRKLQAEKYSDHLADIDVKQELYNYIKKIMELDELPVLIKNQIEKYCNTFELNYKEINDAIYYFIEIQENKFIPKMGIGFVPSIVDESKKFFKELKLTHSRLRKQKLYDFDKIIAVNPIDYQNQTNIIDISKL